MEEIKEFYKKKFDVSTLDIKKMCKNITDILINLEKDYLIKSFYIEVEKPLVVEVMKK